MRFTRKTASHDIRSKRFDKIYISTRNDLRTWFLIFAFVSIGLEFSAKGLRDAGWRPVMVFGSATVVNIVVALGLATVLFGNFELPQ